MKATDLPFICFSDEITNQIVHKEASSFYRVFNWDKSNGLILDNYRLGNMAFKDGRYVPNKDEEIVGYEYNMRNMEIYVFFESGMLQQKINPMLLRSRMLLSEQCFDFSTLGYNRFLIYKSDNPSPILYKKNGEEFYLKWRRTRKKDVRYSLIVSSIKLKRLLDVTNEEASNMGYKKSDGSVLLNGVASIQIDDSQTERNSFFKDFYQTHDADKYKPSSNPFVLISDFELLNV